MRYNLQTTHIILLAILPRAGWTLADKWAYPNRFTTPISKVNDYIQVCPCIPLDVDMTGQSQQACLKGTHCPNRAG